MDLTELVGKYRATAAVLEGRALEALAELEATEDGQAHRFLEERIAYLKTAARESLGCAAVCERYWAMGYRREVIDDEKMPRLWRIPGCQRGVRLYGQKENRPRYCEYRERRGS